MPDNTFLKKMIRANTPFDIWGKKIIKFYMGRYQSCKLSPKIQNFKFPLTVQSPDPEQWSVAN